MFSSKINLLKESVVMKKSMLLYLLFFMHTAIVTAQDHTMLKTYINLIYQLSHNEHQSKDFIELHSSLQNSNTILLPLVITKSAITNALQLLDECSIPT